MTSTRIKIGSIGNVNIAIKSCTESSDEAYHQELVGPYDRERSLSKTHELGLVIARIITMLGDTCRGRLCSDQPWQFGGLKVCSVDGGADVEDGWHRWRLPSLDGLIRLRDPGAPSVSLSPSGATFWQDNDSATPIRLSIDGLRELCKGLQAVGQ